MNFFKSIISTLLLLGSIKVYAQLQIFTAAGTGNSGQLNSTALNSRFNSPVHMVLDSKGNLLISDYSNHCIRKLDTVGNVTTFAGQMGVPGFLNGQGNAARFNGPFYMVIDSLDNLYVCDAFNHSIRRISAQGIVTTLAGNGTLGFLDGAGPNARFRSPYGICFDYSGNLLVSDRFNHAIRSVNISTGVVTTLTGFNGQGFQNGSLAAARFNAPYAIVRDGSGGFFIADRDNNRIRQINSQGVVSTFAGSGAAGSLNGSNLTASFNQPKGLAMDTYGAIYVSDFTGNRIRKIINGTVSTFVNNGSTGFNNGNVQNNVLDAPHGIFVTQDSCPLLFIADHWNHSIRLVGNRSSSFSDTLTIACAQDTILLPNGYRNIFWSTGSHSHSLAVNSGNTYWVRAIYQGCLVTDTFYVKQVNQILNILPDSINLCSPSFISVNSSSPANIVWNNGNTNDSTFAATSGWYFVSTTNTACSLQDSVYVTLFPSGIDVLNDSVDFCTPSYIRVSTQLNADSIYWSNGSNFDSILIQNSGLVTVELYFGECVVRDSILVNFLSAPSVSISDSIVLCAGDTIELNGIPNGYQVVWSNGNTGEDLVPVSSGIYWFELSNSEGCFYSDTVFIEIDIEPLPDLGFDTNLCKGDVFKLYFDLIDSVDYFFSDSILLVGFTINEDVQFWVTQSSKCLEKTDTIKVKAIDCDTVNSFIYIPNVFTPNGDFINDSFSLKATGYDNFEIIIYNRWGLEIFRSNDVMYSWDGTYQGNEAPDGVYMYIIAAKNLSTNSKETYSGHLSLFR